MPHRPLFPLAGQEAPRLRAAGDQPGTLVAHVTNLHTLLTAYGPQVRPPILQAVLDRLQACGLAPENLSQEAALFVARLEAPVAPVQDTARATLDQFLEHLQAAIECQPVEYGPHRIYLQVCLDVFYAPRDGNPLEVQEAFFASESPPNTLAALHADLLRTSTLLDALQTGRMALAFQPIVRQDGTTLYYEALLRGLGDGQQGPASAPGAIGALERLGGITRLDQSVVWTCVQLLERHPALRLGCNVSAASLRDAAWWRLLMDHMAERPHLARRLVLEITETGTVPGAAAAAFALVGRLRACGLLIAIDDMGAGHTTLEFLVRSYADLVKMDRSLLSHALEASRSQTLLRGLVAACAVFCPCVVVEGIETEAEFRAVRSSGAHGMQGYLIQTPELHPAWLRQDFATVADAHTAALCKGRMPASWSAPPRVPAA